VPGVVWDDRELDGVLLCELRREEGRKEEDYRGCHRELEFFP
jgi:hypothetical protein